MGDVGVFSKEKNYPPGFTVLRFGKEREWRDALFKHRAVLTFLEKGKIPTDDECFYVSEDGGGKFILELESI